MRRRRLRARRRPGLRDALVIAGALLWMLGGLPSAGAEHIERYVRPGEPQRQFPAGFEIPVDAQSEGELSSWSDPRLGGWGGDYEGAEACPDGHVARTPVVFVHGTSEDAFVAWRNSAANDLTTVDVRREFLDAGWCPGELWAVSYTGARGYYTYNDANAEEVHDFIQAVLEYTGAEQVDVVAHSLGVTVVRKAVRNHIHEDPATSWMRRFVAIGGANHGSTVCRGYGSTGASHPCEELEPDSPWLADLNGIGETPPGPGYLVIYDSVGDQFYLGPDAHSPRLEGACNHDMPGALHLPIARGPVAVARYQAYLADGVLPACG